MSGFTVPVTLQLRRRNVFYRLHQLKTFGMIHLEQIAILNAFHFERWRRFRLGIALATIAPRSKQAQRSDGKRGLPKSLRLHGITSRPTARFSWLVAFR